jgi:hypothetical protein
MKEDLEAEEEEAEKDVIMASLRGGLEDGDSSSNFFEIDE